jgi:hypothetical protein
MMLLFKLALDTSGGVVNHTIDQPPAEQQVEEPCSKNTSDVAVSSGDDEMNNKQGVVGINRSHHGTMAVDKDEIDDFVAEQQVQEPSKNTSDVAVSSGDDEMNNKQGVVGINRSHGTSC